MSQSWTTDSYDISNDGPSDLSAFEANFKCLKSSFSGLSAPSSPVAGQVWYDSSNKLKRVYANGAWVVLMPGDADQKIWSYCNSVPEGMVAVSISDKVLAIKGGSGAYNVNGGNTAGDWTIRHTHGAGTYSANTYHRHNDGNPVGSLCYTSLTFRGYSDYQGSTTQAVGGLSATGGPSTIWRPAGSIGIMIKPDI